MPRGTVARSSRQTLDCRIQMPCDCQRSVGQCSGVIANEVLRATEYCEAQPSRKNQAALTSVRRCRFARPCCAGQSVNELPAKGVKPLCQPASIHTRGFNLLPRPGYGSFTRAHLLLRQGRTQAAPATEAASPGWRPRWHRLPLCQRQFQRCPQHPRVRRFKSATKRSGKHAI